MVQARAGEEHFGVGLEGELLEADEMLEVGSLHSESSTEEEEEEPEPDAFVRGNAAAVGAGGGGREAGVVPGGRRVQHADPLLVPSPLVKSGSEKGSSRSGEGEEEEKEPGWESVEECVDDFSVRSLPMLMDVTALVSVDGLVRLGLRVEGVGFRGVGGIRCTRRCSFCVFT